MKRKKKIITLLAFMAIVSVVGKLYFDYSAVQNDKERFTAIMYMSNEAMNRLTGTVSRKSVNNYCQYANLKYKKGGLSCFVLVSSNNNTSTIKKDDIIAVGTQVGWVYIGDNTSSIAQNGTNQITSQLFDYEGMSCAIALSKSSESIELQTLCSGPARAEYFPVKK